MRRKIDLKVGCSGYYNWGWKGGFYPQEMPSKEWLANYCKHFNSLEINSTFYKFPTVRIMQNWYKKVPEGFVFAVKAPKIITHLKKFNDCKQFIEDFYLACSQGLAEKLGSVLFQLPPSIHYSEERLKQLITSLHVGYMNVIEFRHKSWWRQDVYDALAARGIIFCTINHPTLPKHFVANTSTMYIRYHGNPELYRTPYTEPEILNLVAGIYKGENVTEAYVYFNNTITSAGAENGMRLRGLMS